MISEPWDSLRIWSQDLPSLADYLTYRIGYDALLSFQVLIRFQMKMYIFLIGVGYAISKIFAIGVLSI